MLLNLDRLRIKRSSDFRYDIAVMRLFAIVVVVFFHTYQMTYANHFHSDVAQLCKEKYYYLTECGLIMVAMPMFVTISGFLFAMQLSKGKYKNFKHVLLDKAKRILIPYFFFVTIFSFTYSGFSLNPYYTGSYWHLWFLSMLFWLFVISYLLKDVLLRAKGIWLVVILVVSYLMMLPDKFVPMILGMHNISKWYFWFVLGFALMRWDGKLTDFISRYHLITPLLLVYASVSYFFPVFYGEDTWYSAMLSLVGVIAFWVIAQKINWSKVKFVEILVWVSSLCFGVYLLHFQIGAYLVSRTSQRVFGINEFALNHIYLFPFLISMSIILISAGLSYLIRKNKYGRVLIG